MPYDPTSHTTTRRLTKSWEFGQRMLYGYNFAEDRFFERSSKSLLVADQSFGADMERFFNDHIENPLANYLDGLAEGALVHDPPWAQQRALVLSMLFQSMRVGAGRGDAEAVRWMNDLGTKDEKFLDQLAAASRTKFRFIGGKLGREPHLFFPADGIAVFPMVGAPADAPGMLFQPTSLTTFFAGIPVGVPEKVAEDQMRAAMANGMISAFSVGLKCDRVVIPSAIRGRDEKNVKAGLLELRGAAKGLADLMGRANQLVQQAVRIVGLE
jgi:hypothetical protein